MASQNLTLYWRIGIVMAERGVRTVRELRRRLSAAGYTISEPQLGRIRKQLPRQIDTRLLAALCVALKCHPGELLALPLASQASVAPPQVVAAAPPAPEPAHASQPAASDEPRHQPATTTPDPLRSVVGPRLRPRLLPKP